MHVPSSAEGSRTSMRLTRDFAPPRCGQRAPACTHLWLAVRARWGDLGCTRPHRSMAAFCSYALFSPCFRRGEAGKLGCTDVLGLVRTSRPVPQADATRNAPRHDSRACNYQINQALHRRTPNRLTLILPAPPPAVVAGHPSQQQGAPNNCLHVLSM